MSLTESKCLRNSPRVSSLSQSGNSTTEIITAGTMILSAPAAFSDVYPIYVLMLPVHHRPRLSRSQSSLLRT